MPPSAPLLLDAGGPLNALHPIWRHCLDSGAAARVHIYGARLPDTAPMLRSERRALQSRLAQRLLAQLLQDEFVIPEKDSHWRLARSASGQPFLEGAAAPRISLSHSGDWVACAAGHVQRLGVDLEQARHRDWVAVAPLALHANEAQWVLDAQGLEREMRALQCWTCKEALVKATGSGVTDWDDLPRMAFNTEGRPTQLPASYGTPDDWHARTFRLADDTTLSVAWQ